ncbi:MAG TPA: hypothetical protein DCM59_15730, partial [Clostridium sp.]|nr:hypothetical protein [Clostridium sp.]
MIERGSDGAQIQYKSLPWIKNESPFTRHILKIKTGSNAKFIQIRFIVNGKGGMDIYQPMLVEGNKSIEGWSPSSADTSREIQAVKSWSENIKHGLRNLLLDTSFKELWRVYAGNKILDTNKTSKGIVGVWKFTGQCGFEGVFRVPPVVGKEH